MIDFDDLNIKMSFYPPPRKLCLWAGKLLSRCPSVRPQRFVYLISLRVMDGISSNLGYTFISTGQIIIIKSKDEGPFL